jgi:hypothetical protein
MADLSITAANVLMSAAGKKSEGIAGEAISAGQPVYKDSSDGNKLKLTDANAAGKRGVVGIALNDAATGQPVHFCISDPALAIGATVSIGYVAILSATPGGIAPVADAASGMEVVILGVGVSTTAIRCNFNQGSVLAAGAVVPA